MIQIHYPAQMMPAGLNEAHPNLPVFDAGLCRLHRCDAHVVAIREGVVVARSSLWWSQTPCVPGQQAGVLGHFAAIDQAGAQEVLEFACAELKRHGCSVAIGPMDGNTWRRYRLVTGRGSEPVFFLEPDNPDAWPGYFTESRFSPLAEYFSAMNGDLAVEDQRIPRTLERLERSGVQLRPLDMVRFIEELRAIHAVSRISFQSNYLYTPIDEAEFLAQYEPVRTHIRPELVIMAEHAGKLVGYVFSIPDLAQARRGQNVDTLVLKTVAVLPGRVYAGLGNVLVAVCQQKARALGFRRAIHALMHKSNNSLNLSGHYGRPFRQYTLYSRSLAGE